MCCCVKKSLTVTDYKNQFDRHTKKRNYTYTQHTNMYTYPNFNIVDLLVWAVLRLAEAENMETVENRGEFVFYREY